MTAPDPRPKVDLASLLSMDPEAGRIALGRERMLLVSVQAMGALRRELHDSLGAALGSEVLFRFGQRCGREEGERVMRELGVRSREEALELGPLLHAFEGVARVRTSVPPPGPGGDGEFHMEGTWEGSYEADEHLRLFGEAEEPVCATLTGYASGYASAVVGIDLLCREGRCRGRGDPECSWSIDPAPAPLPEQLPTELRSAHRHLEARVRGKKAGRTLQALLDHVPAGIALATADQKLVECNRGFREMLGLPEGPLEGLTCFEAFAGLGKPCEDCPGPKLFESGANGRCRPSFVRPDGSRAYFDLRSFPLRDAAGRITHELKYVRDVSREVERDQELEDKRSLATLGELAARVAHEVKNPLAGMRGALQVLASRRPDGDEEKEILVEVVAHIDRLDATVRDLLAFSRPSRPHRESTSPDDVVQAVLSLLRNAPDLRDLRIEFTPSGAPEASLDRQQMVQVLTNLVQNAAQALRPGDDRTVRIAAGPTADGKAVEFRVADRGPGIPDAVRARIGTPFYTTKPRGTGLGLAISRRIVEAHGGHLDFEAAAGGGTLFRVRIPLRGGPPIA